MGLQDSWWSIDSFVQGWFSSGWYYDFEYGFHTLPGECETNIELFNRDLSRTCESDRFSIQSSG